MSGSSARRRSLLAFALLLAAVGCGSDDPDQAANPTDAADTPVDDALTGLADDGFNGVVLIDVAGEVTVEGFGMADREQGIANDGDIVFDIGSLTKQFTGAAIVRLDMDGRLSVDDRLGDHLDALPAELAAVTLHQLLTHTAGVPDVLGDDYEPIDREAFVDLVARTPLVRPPGTEYGYSNVGYSLLAAVIEVVTGQSYEAYLRDALFAPAGMESTGYVLPDFAPGAVAIGYDGDDPAGRPNELPWADDGPYWHLRGNGGILSTANDMHRWHRALLGDAILDETAKVKLYGRHTTEGPGSGTFYGYGWAIFRTPDVPAPRRSYVIARPPTSTESTRAVSRGARGTATGRWSPDT